MCEIIDVIINESKCFQGTISLNNTTSRGGFDQMSDEWIDRVLSDLIQKFNGNADQQNLYRSIVSFLDANGAQKVVTAVDKKTGEIIVINMGNYGQ